MGEIDKKVKAIVIDQLGLRKGVYKKRLPFEVLGADWFDLVELMTIMEEEFGVDMPMGIEVELTSPKKLIAWLKLKQKQKER